MTLSVPNAAAALILALYDDNRPDDASAIMFSVSDTLYSERTQIFNALIEQVRHNATVVEPTPVGSFCLRLTNYVHTCKIDSIKELRAISGYQGKPVMGLKDAKDAIEATGTRNPLVPGLRGTYEEMRRVADSANYLTLTVENY